MTDRFKRERHLTPQMLRDAAWQLWEGNDPNVFRRPWHMCFALHLVTNDNKALDDFLALLRYHKLSFGGGLINPWVDTWNLTRLERQALRFDFLMLLAESLEPV